MLIYVNHNVTTFCSVNSFPMQFRQPLVMPLLDSLHTHLRVDSFDCVVEPSTRTSTSSSSLMRFLY